MVVSTSRNVLRANGARYDSQGQARSEAERVAPGNNNQNVPALKGRNSLAAYFGLSGLDLACSWLTQGDALRACPGLSYIAPLALPSDVLCKATSQLHLTSMDQLGHPDQDLTRPLVRCAAVCN